ncbi:BnaC01g41770D [Brassica napus]|uniref:BnaC01g41770D protein n=1 Tax=Brassica napus TaxID=3708 RepID=A0A078JKT8_BRANA|nr:BnaC01g41770D [Brassica napus]
MDAFINLARQQYQDHPQHFRSERMCFLDHIFSRQWRASYPDFKSDKGDANGLGKRLPGGAWNYHAGEIPSFCQSKKPYTYERQTVGVPQCRPGDCGPFTLKYIECHDLGMEFPKALCPRNGKTIREKMAVDIVQDLHMCHEWENQDNDENLGTYE